MAKSSDGGVREGGAGGIRPVPSESLHPALLPVGEYPALEDRGGEVLPNHKLPTEQELSRNTRSAAPRCDRPWRRWSRRVCSTGSRERHLVTEKASQTKSVKLTGFTEDLFSEGTRPK